MDAIRLFWIDNNTTDKIQFTEINLGQTGVNHYSYKLGESS